MDIRSKAEVKEQGTPDLKSVKRKAVTLPYTSASASPASWGVFCAFITGAPPGQLKAALAARLVQACCALVRPIVVTGAAGRALRRW